MDKVLKEASDRMDAARVAWFASQKAQKGEEEARNAMVQAQIELEKLVVETKK